MLTSIGLSSVFARSSASVPHGYQSTGLSLCCSKYGLTSLDNLFGTLELPDAIRFGS